MQTFTTISTTALAIETTTLDIISIQSALHVLTFDRDNSTCCEGALFGIGTVTGVVNEKMLRGAAVRWLRRLSVRQYSLPVEASGAAAHVAGRVSRETSQDGESDVTGHRSFREANKMRTRTRVKTQLYNLLRSRELYDIISTLHHRTTIDSGPGNESWTVGPPHEAYWLLRSCGSDMFLETTATRMELAHTMWEEFKRRGIVCSYHDTLYPSTVLLLLLFPSSAPSRHVQ